VGERKEFFERMCDCECMWEIEIGSVGVERDEDRICV
jgi:hypothetical protein